MKVQKIRFTSGRYTWIVIGENYLPIKPITGFIRYLNNIGKSPNTIRAYANHLKLYWEYLTEKACHWKVITLPQLAEFVGWLRLYGNYENISYISDVFGRKNSTINSMLGCISAFYKFHNFIGTTNVYIMETSHTPRNRYKSFLYHAFKNKPVQRRIISLRAHKTIPKTISDEQFDSILRACSNDRDRFLITLLFETGLRIGQALLLQHQDLITWDNEIHIIPRDQYLNEAQNKSKRTNIIHVSRQIMLFYKKHCASFNIKNVSSYVFINLKDNTPMRYASVKELFARLSKKIGFKVTPHMLRHTHAKNLMESGWDPSLIQKRLGHASVQTTLDIYSDVNQETLKKAFKAYLSLRGKAHA